MRNVTVSYFKRNQKVQRNKIQSIYERADQSRSERADHIMSRSIRVEHIRDESRRSQADRADGELSDYITERERVEPFRQKEKRKAQREKIRGRESEKSSTEQIGAGGVVQNETHSEENIRSEKGQTNNGAEKYKERWKIMRRGPQHRRGRITMEARFMCGIIGTADEVSGEYSGGRARWRRCGTTGMNIEAEEMRNSNI